MERNRGDDDLLVCSSLGSLASDTAAAEEPPLEFEHGAMQTEPEGWTPRLDEMTVSSIITVRAPAPGNKEDLTMQG